MHFGPGEAVELVRRPVHALPQPVHLHVRLDGVLIEVVARLAHLLGVVAVVPGLDGEACAVFVCERLHVGDLFAHPGHRRRPHLLHQLHGGLGVARHGVLEPVVREGRIAQQPGAFGPHQKDLGADGVVVVLAAVVAPPGPHPPALLAQVPPVGEGQERLHGRAGVGHQPLAVQALVVGAAGIAFDHGGRQALQVVRPVQHQPVGLLVGQLVLVELGEQHGQALVVLGKGLLLLGRQLGALPHEVGVGQPRQALLLWRQLGFGGGIIDRLDARKEPGVLADLVVVGGELGLPLPVQRLDLRAAEGAGEDAAER